jgi:hypothetical protein
MRPLRLKIEEQGVKAVTGAGGLKVTRSRLAEDTGSAATTVDAPVAAISLESAVGPELLAGEG